MVCPHEGTSAFSVCSEDGPVDEDGLGRIEENGLGRVEEHAQDNLHEAEDEDSAEGLPRTHQQTTYPHPCSGSQSINL